MTSNSRSNSGNNSNSNSGSSRRNIAKNSSTTRNAAQLMRGIRPNWPKPIRLIGRGSYGTVFNTNNGRVMKIFTGNVPKDEFNMLKALQGAHFVPRVKNGNYVNIVNSNNFARYTKKHHYASNSHGGVFLMGKVGGMTLANYSRKYPQFVNSASRRLKNMVEYLQIRGFSHGNLHEYNVMVAADSHGHITGMWIIDFGRASYIPKGFYTTNNLNYFQGIFNNNTNTNVWGRHLRNRRSSIARNLKLLTNSKTRIGRSKRVVTPKKSPQRVRSVPGRVNTTRKTPLTSLKRKRV